MSGNSAKALHKPRPGELGTSPTALLSIFDNLISCLNAGWVDAKNKDTLCTSETLKHT